jgi:hypothetical protein
MYRNSGVAFYPEPHRQLFEASVHPVFTECSSRSGVGILNCLRGMSRQAR